MSNSLKEKISLLPSSSGCYLYKDKHSEIIYIGKAKNLKKRVSSYFNRSLDKKTALLVSEISDVDFIVTNNNVESLILENNLIKKHNPRYNIMLKDDKTYPYIKITNEKYPQLIITRKVKKDGGKYFGPYPSSHSANEVLKLLNRLYPLRKCNPIPKQTCLYFHLGQCLAPCVNEIEKSTFDNIVSEISSFLNGNSSSIKKQLQEKMNLAAEKLEFEKAKEFRDQLLHIENLMEKQKIDLQNLSNSDYFHFSSKNNWMCVQVFFVRNGNIIERDTSVFPCFDNEEELFHSFVFQFYNNHVLPKEIFIPHTIDTSLLSDVLDCKVNNPSMGKNFELLKLAENNAKISLENKFTLLTKEESKTIGSCEKLGELLNIDTPLRIEAFDNSHYNGVHSVSAMITFINGKPSKKHYRKYKLNDNISNDDYSSMYEVLKRRYSKIKDNTLPLPGLIIVDGGKGQLDVAHRVIKKELKLDIPIISLVKNEKHKTEGILFGSPIVDIPINKHSDEFYLLERIQDEVHRFAVSFMRQQHNTETFRSELDNINGLGPKSKQKLLTHFNSVKKIKSASIDELLSSGINKNLANSIFDFFNK